MADLASLGTIFNPDYQGIGNIRLNYGPYKAIPKPDYVLIFESKSAHSLDTA